MYKPQPPKQNATPEERILETLQRATIKAKSAAGISTKTPAPASPHHWHPCLYCTAPGKTRGSGLMPMQVNYYRADRMQVCTATAKTLCPACNGYGIQLTELGRKVAEQEQRQRRAAA